MSKEQSIKRTVQVTVTLSLSIEINEVHIPTTGVKARPKGTQRTGNDQAWREGDDMQRRLFSAVLSNKNTLDEYIRFCAANSLSELRWQTWHELVRDTDDDDIEKILAPVIQTLAEKDQEQLRGASEEGVFLENVEQFYDCWQGTIDEATIEIIDPQ